MTGLFPLTFLVMFGMLYQPYPPTILNITRANYVPTKVCHGRFLPMMLATVALFFGAPERTRVCFDSGHNTDVKLRMYMWGG